MLREVRRKTVVLGGKFEDGELEIEENEVRQWIVERERMEAR